MVHCVVHGTVHYTVHHTVHCTAHYTVHHTAPIVAQVFWTRETEAALAEGGLRGLREYETKCTQQLNDVVTLVRRRDLTKLNRSTLGAMVTLDVHGRDVLTMMVKAGVESTVGSHWIDPNPNPKTQFQPRFHPQFQPQFQFQFQLRTSTLAHTYSRSISTGSRSCASTTRPRGRARRRPRWATARRRAAACRTRRLGSATPVLESDSAGSWLRPALGSRPLRRLGPNERLRCVRVRPGRSRRLL